MLNLPVIQRNHSKPPYRKPSSVKVLEQLAMTEARYKYPTLPEHALAPRMFRDDNSNGLTRCIATYVTLKGGFASRINNQGTYKQRLHKCIPETSRKGLADIMAPFRGLSLHIEVKVGKERQSEAQKRIESEVNRSGGFYYVAKDFESFKNWIDSL